MHQAFYSQRYRPLLIAMVVFAVLFVFLLLTDPTKLPLVALLVPFVLLFTALYQVLCFILEVIAGRRLSRRYQKVIAIILASEPVLLILLASINQLTVRDGILSFMLVVGLASYLNRIA